MAIRFKSRYFPKRTDCIAQYFLSSYVTTALSFLLFFAGAARAEPLITVEQVQKSLQAARQDYTASNFRRCRERLQTTELAIRSALHLSEMLPQAKRLQQWLGLCQAVDKLTADAQASFALARRLPGPDPDPAVFPPSVMILYAPPSTPPPYCVLQPAASIKQAFLDGNEVLSSGMQVEVGAHYLSWQDQQMHSTRLNLTPDCHVLMAPEDGHASSGSASEKAILIAIHPQAAPKASKPKYSISDDKIPIYQSPTPAEPNHQAQEPNAKKKKSNLSYDDYSPTTERDAPTSAWYQKWWVWAAAAGVVAAAIIIPLSLRPEQEPHFALQF